MKACNKPCSACPYALPGHTVTSPANGHRTDINIKADCNTSNVVYALFCKKTGCKTNFYVGQTQKTMRERFLAHRGYVTRKEYDKTTGSHWNEPGHSVSDMGFTVLEKVFKKDEAYRKQREIFYIQKMEAKYKGMNRDKGG